MIKELTKQQIIDSFGDTIGERAPSNFEIMKKINEIIRYLNEEEKETTNEEL